MSLFISKVVTYIPNESMDAPKKYVDQQGVALTKSEWIEYLEEIDFESYRNIQGLYDMWNEEFTEEMKEVLNDYYRKRKAQFRKTGR